MGIFDWHAGQAGDDHTIVSNWIWLYFVLSIALTLIVVIVWITVSKCLERRQMKKLSEKGA